MSYFKSVFNGYRISEWCGGQSRKIMRNSRVWGRYREALWNAHGNDAESMCCTDA